MASKLSSDVLEQIEGLIGTKLKDQTEQGARKALVQFLEKHDLSGVEDDPLTELISMAEVFVEDEPVKPAKATSKKAAAVVEDEEEEEPEEEPEEDPAEEEEEPEEEEEEEETPPPPSKKPAAKPAAKAPAAKPAAKKETEAKPAATRTTLPGEKFDSRNNPKHKKLLKPFEDLFPKKDFEIIELKQGFTVRVLGKNAKTTIINYDDLKVVDGKLFGNLYTNRFRDVDDLLETLPDEYHDREIGMFRMESHPCVRRITQDEFFDIMENSELLSVSLERANAKDVKMGTNRAKLEETLNSGTPVKAKTSTTAKTAPAKAPAKPVAKKK